uniref:Kinesin-like protein n=1 Tax=Palpitomonas bilix TaxID=652834 RepID=A0A7S3DF42_9EUKA|mmetsp:Transcript_35014/g.90716  ORF Transcript_35014/g.90716 Transcript_35014/m.90716 type:complete len:878 (+) Transcript_35014:208-2841(+)
MAEAVRVLIRCRPLNSREKADGRKQVVELDMKSGSVSIKNPASEDPPKTFTFDQVFDNSATQADVYEYGGKPVVNCVLEGFNGTMFAYGQTGTGKTHSMQGKPKDPVLKGLIPRSFEHVFGTIGEAPEEKQYLVRVQYLEIYNEEVRDLLGGDHNVALELKEHPDKGVYVKDLSAFVVKSVQEMDQYMETGNGKRSVGFTQMNADSSRSHSIFTVTVEMSEPSPDGGEPLIRVGKLNLVDLAGSERSNKTGATGDRLKEGIKINLSLTALGNVISALVDGKSKHVPYRDSKLTRLLQDSLGGNTKTTMVAMLGPADYNYDETLSTLRYANRAKNIKNKPKINEDPKDALLRQFQAEIEALKQQLLAAQNGAPMDPAVLQQLMNAGAPAAPGAAPPALPAPAAVPAAAPAADGSVAPAAPSGGGEIVREVIVEKVVHVPVEGGGGDVSNMSEEMMKNMEAKLEEERKKILAEKEMLEEDREEKIRNLEKRESQLRREREKRHVLATRLKQLQEKLLVGGENILEKAEQAEQQLSVAHSELEERRRQQEALEKKLDEELEEKALAEEKFSSLQEEVEMKTKRMKRLALKCKSQKTEIRDLQEEFEREREDLLDTIRELTKELKFQQKIQDHFIPPTEVNKIKRRAKWSEESDDWIIAKVQFAGNNVRRPVSAAGERSEKDNPSNGHEGKKKRGRQLSARHAPTSLSASGEVKLSNSEKDGQGPVILVDRPPKAPPRSVLKLELEMPKRTTINLDAKEKKRGSSKSPQPSPTTSMEMTGGLLTYGGKDESRLRGPSPTASFDASTTSSQAEGAQSKRGKSSKRKEKKKRNEAALQSIMGVDNGLGGFSGLGDLLRELDDGGKEEDNFPKARGLVGERYVN